MSGLVDEGSSIHSSDCGGKPASPVLDFLVPSGALKLARKLSKWRADKTDILSIHAPPRRREQRQFTSAAGSSPLVLYSPPADIPIPGNVDISVDLKDKLVAPTTASLVDFLKTDMTDYDELWRIFEATDSRIRNKNQQRVLQELSKSTRAIDATRYLQLFDDIDYPRIDQYLAAMRAHLVLRQDDKAIHLNAAILEEEGSPVGTSFLLAHFVKCHSWERSFEVWVTSQRYRHDNAAWVFDIWAEVDRDPKLLEHAREIAKYVRDDREISIKDGDHRYSKQSFAICVIERALLRNRDEPKFDPSNYKALLHILQEWGAETDYLYESAIKRLSSMRRHKLVMEFYNEYRMRVKDVISGTALKRVLLSSCHQHDKIATQRVLDDWVKFHGRIPVLAYRICMQESASQDDTTRVRSLFGEAWIKLKEHNLPLPDADFISPLLHVHAKRGELSKVVEIFESMEDSYGIAPNITIWNILINAYGKVYDVDGAHKRFNDLLQTSIKPDDYTFGTMMGIYATRGDLQRILEFYHLAKQHGVDMSTSMIGCVVQGYVQDGDLDTAESWCERALQMGLRGSRTRMWNTLLTAHAMRRDLNSTNRVLGRMREVGIDYDGETYAALMQALAIVRQPGRAERILEEVMPEAGIPITDFHYAIVMGGYLQTKQIRNIFSLQKRMRERGVVGGASSHRVIMAASLLEDDANGSPGSEQVNRFIAAAEDSFFRACIDKDLRSGTAPSIKGSGRLPANVPGSVNYFSFMIFVHGVNGLFDRVRQMYQHYIDSVIPAHQLAFPVKLLSALMATNLEQGNFEGVYRCWDLAFKTMKLHAKPTSAQRNSEVLPFYKYGLNTALTLQIKAYAQNRKVHRLPSLVAEVESAGFKLDNLNWNAYVQALAHGQRYREAFEITETKLMDGWQAWPIVRHRTVGKKSMPWAVRDARWNSSYLRPVHETIVRLARGFLQLQAAATHSRPARQLLADLERSCPRVVHAIRTLDRPNDAAQREFLEGG